MSVAWRPSADTAALQARAALFARIRQYFSEVGVLEVETPICAAAVGTDPALAPFKTCFTGPGHPRGLTLYLQTSPEYAMKRLLAAGSGPIFQICKAFRDGEAGSRHNPEFTLLEWYRPGIDYFELMGEVTALARLGLRMPQLAEERVTYRDAFVRELALDPLSASDAEVIGVAHNRISGARRLDLDSRDAWLDLILSALIEPTLGKGKLTYLYQYPASQAVLAQLDPCDAEVAQRFELYYQGIELANGFAELTAANEQRARLVADNRLRRDRGQEEVPVDERFLAALTAGLPTCSGVAMGLDRLLMLLLGESSLNKVIAFPLDLA